MVINIENNHTSNPLTLWNAFVSVQLHIPGNPQRSAGERETSSFSNEF